MSKYIQIKERKLVYVKYVYILTVEFVGNCKSILIVSNTIEVFHSWSPNYIFLEVKYEIT